MGLPDFQGLKDAVSLRSALTQADSYLYGGVEPPEEKVNVSFASRLMPVVTANGRAFARQLLRAKQIVVVPSGVKEGTVVEYKDSTRGSFYGVVMKGPVNIPGEEAVYVNPMTAKAAAELVRSNPETVHLTLTAANVSAAPEHIRVSQPRHIVDYFIDPLDRLVMRIFIGLFGKVPDPFTPQQILVAELGLGILLAVIVLICMQIVAN